MQPGKSGRRIGVILGSQRSGSTALGRALAQVTGVCYFGEIFHAIRGPEDALDYEKYLANPDANFFSFKETLIRRFPSLVYPSPKNQATIWSLFQNHLFSLDPNKFIIVDVKYNSTHHLNSVWQEPLELPGLISLLRASRVPIVHLVRNDLFAQAVSVYIAGQTKTWHKFNSEQKATVEPLKFNPQRLAALMVSIHYVRKHMSHLLKDYPVVQEFVYEVAYSEGKLTAATCADLRQLFELDSEFSGNTDLRKVLDVPLRELFANADEVLRFFENHQFQADVAKHLS